MVTQVETVYCPHCGESEQVVRYGYNRGGTAKCRCKDCRKVFTPRPNPRATTPETEERILGCLSERLSIEATARLLKVAKKTIYKVLKKRGVSPPGR